MKNKEKIRQGIQDVLEENGFERFPAADLASVLVQRLEDVVMTPIHSVDYKPPADVFERFFGTIIPRR